MQKVRADAVQRAVRKLQAAGGDELPVEGVDRVDPVD